MANPSTSKEKTVFIGDKLNRDGIKKTVLNPVDTSRSGERKGKRIKPLTPEPDRKKLQPGGTEKTPGVFFFKGGIEGEDLVNEEEVDENLEDEDFDEENLVDHNLKPLELVKVILKQIGAV